MTRHQITLRTASVLLSLPLLGIAATGFAAPPPLPTQTSPTPSTAAGIDCLPVSKTLGVLGSSGGTTKIEYVGGFTCSGGSVSYYTVDTSLEQSTDADGPWTLVGDAPQTFSGLTSTGKRVTYILKPPSGGDWYRTDVVVTSSYGALQGISDAVYAVP